MVGKMKHHSSSKPEYHSELRDISFSRFTYVLCSSIEGINVISIDFGNVILNSYEEEAAVIGLHGRWF